MAQQQQRYRVLERIASGGMAEVFRAESAGLEGFKKKVAIKRVLPHLSEKKEFIGMFLDEARLSAHLSHSNCVQVFDIGRGDNTYFIVMEMVDGADLKAIIESRHETQTPFPVEEACFICVRICEGLAYAHELIDEHGHSLNIVHRDMSPPNVLITRYGEIKIVDFGLAKANSQLEESQPGIIKGKFGYLSPEAAQGKHVDHRTDIFAVGIILWELLTGRRLFLGKTDLETVKQVQRAEVPDVRRYNPHVPESVAQVLLRALAANPNERYQSAREFGYQLNHVLFSLPRAVSSFDIAQLVLPVEQQRQSDRRRSASGTLIGNLIDQALIEFTSLDKDGSPSNLGSSPLDVHSFVGEPPADPAAAGMDWESSLGFGQPASSPDASTEVGGLELGNLSALEEERSAAHAPRVPPEPAETPASEPPVEGKVEGKKKGGTLALLLVLLLVAGAAAAYYAGLIPPSALRSLGL